MTFINPSAYAEELLVRIISFPFDDDKREEVAVNYETLAANEDDPDDSHTKRMKNELARILAGPKAFDLNGDFSTITDGSGSQVCKKGATVYCESCQRRRRRCAHHRDHRQGQQQDGRPRCLGGNHVNDDHAEREPAVGYSQGVEEGRCRAPLGKIGSLENLTALASCQGRTT